MPSARWAKAPAPKENRGEDSAGRDQEKTAPPSATPKTHRQAISAASNLGLCHAAAKPERDGLGSSTNREMRSFSYSAHDDIHQLARNDDDLHDLLAGNERLHFLISQGALANQIVVITGGHHNTP